MSTQFFERQEAQRKYTRWLVTGFIAAILLVIAVINLVVLVGPWRQSAARLAPRTRSRLLDLG